MDLNIDLVTTLALCGLAYGWGEAAISARRAARLHRREVVQLHTQVVTQRAEIARLRVLVMDQGEELIERREELSDLETELGSTKQVLDDTDREADHWAKAYQAVTGIGGDKEKPIEGALLTSQLPAGTYKCA